MFSLVEIIKLQTENAKLRFDNSNLKSQNAELRARIAQISYERIKSMVQQKAISIPKEWE